MTLMISGGGGGGGGATSLGGLSDVTLGVLANGQIDRKSTRLNSSH